MIETFRTPFTLYEFPIRSLTLNLSSGDSLDVSGTLSNGRANYILFQHVVAHLTGLHAGSEGGSSDLVDDDGRGYEVKAYYDTSLHPAAKYDWFQTSASSTFGANNNGPRIKALLGAGDYAGALAICRATGYDKNDFYVYTNTRGYTCAEPFRYFVVPQDTVLRMLSPTDPRLISRSALLEMVTTVVQVG